MSKCSPSARLTPSGTSKTALRARNQAHRPVAGKSQKRGRKVNVAGSTHGKGLTRLRRSGPPAPAAAAAWGGRRGRHVARGTCARKGQVPSVSAPSFPPPHRTDTLAGLRTAPPLPAHCYPGSSLAADARRVAGRTRQIVLLHRTSRARFRASCSVVNALGGAPPITAAPSHGSASGRRHCAATGGLNGLPRRPT